MAQPAVTGVTGPRIPEGSLPTHFADIKREIAAATPDFEAKFTAAWSDLIAELALRTEQIAKAGSDVRLSGHVPHYMKVGLCTNALDVCVVRPASGVCRAQQLVRTAARHNQASWMCGDQEHRR
jgi:hypothetical protein